MLIIVELNKVSVKIKSELKYSHEIYMSLKYLLKLKSNDLQRAIIIRESLI